MRNKITVIGAGHVGESVAFNCARMGLGDVVLVDVLEGMPQGKALDMFESSPVEGFDSNITGTNFYSDTERSDIIVMTAGLPRKPGMSRDDLLYKNLEIVEDCIGHVAGDSPDAIVIMVTNPLDAMCEAARRVTGFPRERVIGMAGILDSARMRSFIALELGVSVKDTHAFVLGGHGDTMVPLARYSTVAGIPITKLMPEDRVEAIIERTRKGGGEIVALLKTGSAYYAPALAVAEMVDAILNDRHKILPCAAFLQGEYGIDDLYVGVPIQLGRKGMEKIVEIDLSEEENEALQKSAAAVKELVDLFPQKAPA
ncbi:MAG: malate dehydrogenase [Thermoanaerobaculia bacterium]